MTVQQQKARRAYLSGAATAIPAARLDYLKRVLSQGSLTVKILDIRV